MRKRTTGLMGRVLRAARRARGFGRNETGATLIEFALLAFPFFTIVAATLETALIFLAGQILDSAVQDSARLVRTGQAQMAVWGPEEFRDAICEGLYGMFDCADGDTERLRVNVTVIDDFETGMAGYPLEFGDDCDPIGCDWTLEDAYTPGTGGNVVLVQAYYKWPIIINLPGFNWGTLPDGSRLLGASRVFMNEPFACNSDDLCI